jgi:hypothetical protein
MKRIAASIGLAILTATLAACTGNSNGANFIPQTQSQARHAQDAGAGGGPVQRQSVVDDAGAGGGPN